MPSVSLKVAWAKALGALELFFSLRGGNSRLKHRASPRRCSTTSCPATDFEQECGAPHAALRISRVVSDVVRAYGVAGGRYG